MYSKFLIVLSSMLLLFSVHPRGRACMGPCVSGGLHPKQRRHGQRAAAEVRIEFTEGVEYRVQPNNS